MQGLNTTATHGHAALFGVYGMLGIGLTLFCMRGLSDPKRWSEGLLKASFWCLNIGLAMMVLLSLFPQGLYQAYQSFTRDYAFARSAEVIHGPVMRACGKSPLAQLSVQIKTDVGLSPQGPVLAVVGHER